LHVVLQRLARQPQPVFGAEARRRRVRAAAGDGRGERRAAVRDVPGRSADLRRPRSEGLVRIGCSLHAARLRRRGDGDGHVEEVDGVRARGGAAVRRAGRRPDLRAARPGDGADDATPCRASRADDVAGAARADVQPAPDLGELELRRRGSGRAAGARHRLSRGARRGHGRADRVARGRSLRAGGGSRLRRARAMRILFVMEHSGVGPLVPALRLLHDRGHTIHLAARRVKTGHSHEELEALAADCARITYGPLAPGGGSWSRLARSLRFGIDYLRYLEPRYRDATKLRARAEGRAPAAVRRVGGIASRVGAPAVVALRRSLQLAERSIPPPRSHLRYLAEFEPDVVLITPLVDLGSRQSDWLRAAKRLGIRTVYPVFSWDNLTNKGLLRDIPDRVLVWNDLQRREAAELHRVPADRIRLTGAPVCDPWFEWRPSRSREEFCREVGLRADRPIVLYVCSSPFVAPGEPEFLRTWVERLRSHGDVLAEAGILIRPYPDTAGRWRDAAPEDPQVRVWPRSGEAPHDEVSRRNFFDSIFHAAAVVGINTTAQIESAIVGRP